MKQFNLLLYTTCVALLLALVALPLRAQVIDDDSDVVATPKRPDRLIGQLQSSLKRNIDNSTVADSLLTVSRRLHYLPGQVVALCQLAGIRFRQQQTSQATALLQEAVSLAVQIQGMRDVGWVMGQLGRLQAINTQKDPAFVAALAPVLAALGTAMNASVSAADKNKGSRFMPFDPMNGPEKRRFDRYAPPVNSIDNQFITPNQPSIPIPDRRKMLKPDFIDRWLDTLITNAVGHSPQIARKLTARKKIRDSSEAMSKAFAKEGDYAKAYQYFLRYSAYKDSLTTEATNHRLASLEYKQNLLKKEAQIQLLTKERQLREQASNRQQFYLVVLLGGVALLGGFSVVLSRNNRAKQLANHLLNEQKETLQQTLAELKTTQTQLIQSEKMASLGELTAGIAHEIQNPLNFVNNFSDVSNELISELLENRQQSAPDPELETELLTDVRQNLQKISQHGNRASAIVRGMLEHARSSSGQKQLTDLNALTDEYARLAYHGLRAKENGATIPFEAALVTELDPTIGQVSLIPQEIGRVLLNLFNNAFYAVRQRQQQGETDYKGEVRIITSREAGQVRVTIRDNGTGIPAQVRQKIFQPFFTTKPTGEGTGLGLSLSYDIITKGHGGNLLVASEAGRFTEMTITLPV